ncbi:DinB family protein [Paraflavitalea sp. CAU 1676]|uniref:DinB family protein n=1 Tax=Paraflavitalea sp. CAU 1676 TaxID=3032598 RepID=UPI0023DBF911|nr:DinB family protein [Paraflavitalea sp. CAU 1676]MDF2190563.1 DinB family protein [Paraflavitalea sp. CAU 1676]
MKMLRTWAFLFLLTAGAIAAQGQSSTDDVIKEWERAKAYTKEYLDAMPDSGYGFKPTPDMRSFAEQMLHLTDANYMFAATALGEKPPVTGLEKSTTDKSKANITKLVLAGYDYMIASIKKLTPAQQSEKIKLFGRFDLTKGETVVKAFEHQTHHRGQTTVYLRLEGVKPPQERLF